MIYVMYRNRLDSIFWTIKAAEKYVNQQKESNKYIIVKESLEL